MPRLLFSLVPLLLLTFAPALFTDPSQLPGYSSLRDCSTYAFNGGINSPLLSVIGCNDYTCACSHFADSASAVSSIATARCSTSAGPDVAAATSLWNAFCAQFLAEPTDATTPTGAATSPAATTSSSGTSSCKDLLERKFDVIDSLTLTASIVTTTDSGGQVSVYTTAVPELIPVAPGGLSESDKIALGVGIGIGLPATIAGIIVCCLAIGGNQ